MCLKLSSVYLPIGEYRNKGTNGFFEELKVVLYPFHVNFRQPSWLRKKTGLIRNFPNV